MKNEEQPHVSSPLKYSPKCGAYSRRTKKSCRQPAMANGRCRLHGGKSTGPPKGNQNALKHGFYTQTAIATRRKTREIFKNFRDLLNEV